jgi:hypothetical protein
MTSDSNGVGALVLTVWITTRKRQEDGTEADTGKRPKRVAVFHVSQTIPQE